MPRLTRRGTVLQRDKRTIWTWPHHLVLCGNATEENYMNRLVLVPLLIPYYGIFANSRGKEAIRKWLK